jgi:hypothetical protein
MHMGIGTHRGNEIEDRDIVVRRMPAEGSSRRRRISRETFGIAGGMRAWSVRSAMPACTVLRRSRAWDGWQLAYTRQKGIWIGRPVSLSGDSESREGRERTARGLITPTKSLTLVNVGCSGMGFFQGLIAARLLGAEGMARRRPPP